MRALHQGIAAADASQPLTTCPYEASGEDLSHTFAAIWWIKGWRRAMPQRP